MNGLMLAYADLAETNKSGGAAKSGGGEYGMSLMDKNKDTRSVRKNLSNIMKPYLIK